MDGLWCGSQNCPEHLGYDSEVDCCDIPSELLSPNYPQSYDNFDIFGNRITQTWLITADLGTIINLQFHSFIVSLLGI